MALDTVTSSVERDRRGRPLPPRGIGPTSMKWALIVPLLAVAMLVVVILINVVDAPGPPPISITPKISSSLGLTVSPSNPFKPIVALGEPPTEILSSVVLPSPAHLRSRVATGGEATSFDASFKYRSSSSQGALYSFFSQEMAARGWKIFSVGAPTGSKGVEILAQRAGSDGWFWEEGVVIHPTSFSQHAGQSTSFTIRLYQASSDA
jgi:hypothetical protein